MARSTLVAMAVVAVTLIGCGDDGEAQPDAAATAGAGEATDQAVEATESPTAGAGQEQSDVYRVKRGDTLSEIAERFNTTVRRLARHNGLDDPNAIKVGQRLRIPPGD